MLSHQRTVPCPPRQEVRGFCHPPATKPQRLDTYQSCSSCPTALPRWIRNLSTDQHCKHSLIINQPVCVSCCTHLHRTICAKLFAPAPPIARVVESECTLVPENAHRFAELGSPTYSHAPELNADNRRAFRKPDLDTKMDAQVTPAKKVNMAPSLKFFDEESTCTDGGAQHTELSKDATRSNRQGGPYNNDSWNRDNQTPQNARMMTLGTPTVQSGTRSRTL